MPQESRAVDPMGKKDSRRKKICLTGCRYDVVGRVALELGFKCVQEYDLWDIIWSDSPLPNERVNEMRRIQNLGTTGAINIPSMQKMNHFPGMYEICRKDRLGRNLNKYKRVFPTEYNFFPLTWDLPSDLSVVTDFAKRNKGMTFIVKPDSGCQGRGIFLIKNLKVLSPFAKCVAQQYMSQPFLVDGYKYDQRIYVLITCVDPLRIYLYEEGIARFATVKYNMPNDENLDIIFMHLTNYSLNKFSESYDPQREGSKRKLSGVYKWMEDHSYDTKQLRRDIDDIIIKTVICAARTLRHNYRTSFPKENRGCSCFELLGFDILVDRFLKPILIEVNHSPSFNLDLEVDNVVKTQLLRDVFKMMYFERKSDSMPFHRVTTPPHGRSSRSPPTSFNDLWPALQEQFLHEQANIGGFRLIFSEENSGKYAKFLDKDILFSYSDFGDESFLKPRPEPMSVPPTSDLKPWSQGFIPESSLKVTKTGQVYVETKPPSPGVLNPQEFMKFKYNVTAKRTISAKNKERTVVTTDKGLEEKKLCDPKSPQGDGNMTGVSPDGNNKNDSPPAEKSTEIDTRTPSQRVQAAIEKLRWKGMSKFQFIRESNGEATVTCRPSSGSSQSQSKESDNTEQENTSSFPKNQYEREIGSRSRPASALVNESRHSPYLADVEIPKMNLSQLPSVMQDFINSNAKPKERKTRTDKEFVKKWVATEVKRPPPAEAGHEFPKLPPDSPAKDNQAPTRKDKRNSETFVNDWIKTLKGQLPSDSTIMTRNPNKIQASNQGNLNLLKSHSGAERISSKQRRIEQGL